MTPSTPHAASAPPAPLPAPGAGGPDGIVVDTNAVLDWLVFDDPRAGFGRAIERGELRWIATPAMLAECRRLFASSSLTRWTPDGARLEQAWARWACVEAAAVPPAPWRCRDPDDQMFVDLALAHRTPWLITRDRALLRLASHLRQVSVHILTPERWEAAWAARSSDATALAPEAPAAAP